jgi:thiol-disulfide isomerase/thioredoxin
MIKHRLGLFVGVLISALLLGCSNKPAVVEVIDPETPGINQEIKTILTSGKPAVVVLGTGLCANCKIVADIVNSLKEKRKDLEVSWIVYEDYRDQATFKAFHLTISPTTYLITTNHEVKRKLTGTYTEQELLDAMKEEGLIH